MNILSDTLCATGRSSLSLRRAWSGILALSRAFATAWTLMLLPVLPFAAQAQGMAVYMAADGKDANSGASPGTAVASLERALQVAIRQAGPGGTEILVAPGTYREQRNVLRLKTEPPPIAIRAADSTQRPIFDGETNQGTWLRVLAQTPMRLPITIEGLDVRRYSTALSIEAPFEAGAGKQLASAVKVLSNRFEDIGSPQAPPSTAALRFVGISESIVKGNSFLRVRNAGDCSLLHPIYMAHGSNRNRIEGNSFDDNCGVAIKLRDASNENQIVDNEFRRQTLSAVFQDWYCDATKRKDCERKDECPSWSNRFAGNRLDGKPVTPVALDIRHGERPSNQCELPAVRERVLMQSPATSTRATPRGSQPR